MLHADKVLLQTSLDQIKSRFKHNMVELREKELNLSIDNFSSIGTQAALLSGFSMTAFAEIGVPDDAPWILQFGFYMFTSIAMASSMHCVCNTTFITVWGPGLALRGPDGSIDRAIDGMVEERVQVFTSFGLALLSFQLAAMMAGWMTMPLEISLATTTVSLLAVMMVGYFGRRVFLRFAIPKDRETRLDDLSELLQDPDGSKAWYNSIKEEPVMVEPGPSDPNMLQPAYDPSSEARGSRVPPKRKPRENGSIPLLFSATTD
jgi:hypothetical protein